MAFPVVSCGSIGDNSWEADIMVPYTYVVVWGALGLGGCLGMFVALLTVDHIADWLRKRINKF
jgi:hypothetical protein